MLDKSDELQDRLEARKHALLARLSELEADTRAQASEARTQVEHRLEELERNDD